MTLDKQERSEPMDELEQHIFLLQDPFGDEAHRLGQEQAVQYLLAHSEQAHPRLLELLVSDQASNPFAIVEVLPRFGRPESVPILKDLLLKGPQNLARAAGEALANHPLDTALEALLDGLEQPTGEVVAAAAAGLMLRGDPVACPGLTKVMTHDDPIVRYYVIQAAARLSCLDRARLSDIARADPDSDVRELASRLIQGLS